MVQLLWKTRMAVPQENKNQLTIRSSNPTSEYVPHRIETRGLREVSVHPASQQPKGGSNSSAHQWTNGYVVHPHDGIFFSLKKEVLIYATTWIKHEDNMPSGRNQLQENPNTTGAPYMRPHEMQSRMVVAMGWEERGLSISCSFQFHKMKGVLETDGGDSRTTIGVYYTLCY